MAEWVNLGLLADFQAGRGAVREAAGLLLAVFEAGGEIVVFPDRCPHAGGSLGQGWTEEGEAVCPLHHWRFRLADGRCTTMRGQGVHRFPAEIRGDEVWVRV
jgi:nitrite reductase/ring-hydroxylating ferredoxin subunit